MNWDIYSKLLLKECPQDFVSYCVSGARFVCLRETQFQTRARSRYRAREMRGDSVIEAELNENHFLIHIEWQSDKDLEMDFRLLGYCYEAMRLHKLPVLSMAIYLQAVSDIPRGPKDACIPTGRRTLWFDFDNLELGEQGVARFRQLNLDAFYTLMLLCKDGARYEILDEILERLEQRKRKELIAITRFFAGKVFTSSADRKRLGRRFAMLRDFLQDSWTFQETLQEGREEGRQEGILLDKQSIETIAQTRFPDQVDSLKKKIASLNDLEQIHQILNAVATAPTADELRQFLTTFA